VFKSAVESGGAVEGLCVPGGAEFSRRDIDGLTDMVKSLGAKGLVSIAFTADPVTATEDQIRSPVLKFLGLEMTRSIGMMAGAKAGDLVLIVAGAGGMPAKEPGSKGRVKPVLDALRRHLAERLQLADPNELAFLWVVDFPLFEWSDDEERWDPTHHLFTSARAEDLEELARDPGKVRSNAYDIVCNGAEIGGGSIRIHERGQQEAILNLLKITPEQAYERFGHMLDAFEFGAPPHGGIACGIDRTAAMLAQTDDIREMIAFPKTKSATDLMTGAPSPADPAQLDTLRIKVEPGD
jgi:aspartyl-tRNA synthetase